MSYSSFVDSPLAFETNNSQQTRSLSGQIPASELSAYTHSAQPRGYSSAMSYDTVASTASSSHHHLAPSHEMSHSVQHSPLLQSPPSRISTPIHHAPHSNGGGYYTTNHVSPQQPQHAHSHPMPSYHGTPVLHSSLSAPTSPQIIAPAGNHEFPLNANPSAAGNSSIRVIQWTPQSGEEGTQVTVVLSALAVNAARATNYSLPNFGSGSPGNSPRRNDSNPITRRFKVVFGHSPAPTKFNRAQNIDGNGVGQSMSAGPNEEDAFVVLSAFVPARQSMGNLNERVFVAVQIVDEHGNVVEESIVGEWDAHIASTPPRRNPNPFKRAGEDLLSDRDAPILRSPASHSFHNSPVRPHLKNEFLSPQIAQNSSPRISSPRSRTPINDDGTIVHGLGNLITSNLPPNTAGAPPSQPGLLRTSQIQSNSPTETSAASPVANKALLQLDGDLDQMAMGWSNDEWVNRRRLIQFWRQQEGNVINATFRPISQADFVPNSIVISCIFRDDWNECFITSVDTIYLLEALVGVRFTVEEKNRIRRNLEGFKPITVSKSKIEQEPFFKLIMGFPNPKPRNIEKDVKVFPWKILSNALKKIISKYSATYTSQHPDSLAANTTPEIPGPLLKVSEHEPLKSSMRNSLPSSPVVLTSPQFGGNPSPRLGPPLGSPHIGYHTTHGTPNMSHSMPNSPHVDHNESGRMQPGPIPRQFEFGSSLDANSNNFHHSTYPPPAAHNLYTADTGYAHHAHHPPAPPQLHHNRSYSEGPRSAGLPNGEHNGPFSAGPYRNHFGTTPIPQGEYFHSPAENPIGAGGYRPE